MLHLWRSPLVTPAIPERKYTGVAVSARLLIARRGLIFTGDLMTNGCDWRAPDISFYTMDWKILAFNMFCQARRCPFFIHSCLFFGRRDFVEAYSNLHFTQEIAWLAATARKRKEIEVLKHSSALLRRTNLRIAQMAPSKPIENRPANMNKKQSLLLALTAAALAAVSNAQAQNTFNNEDLLLNFRNYSTQTDPNVTIDLGNVNSFVSSVAALPGGIAVLNSGSGFGTSAYPTQFSYSALTGLLGAPSSGNLLGFSAAAADGTGSGLLFLTRKQASSSLVPPSISSSQQGLTAQADTAQSINNIGLETENGTTLSGSGPNAVFYPSGNVNSYQSQGQDPANTSTIDFGGSQSTANGAGGKIELQPTGSGNLYEGLWEVPVSGNGSDTYEGYFTFQSDGEVDFTTVTTVPEPSVLSMLLLGSLVIVGLRFRARSAGV